MIRKRILVVLIALFAVAMLSLAACNRGGATPDGGGANQPTGAKPTLPNIDYTNSFVEQTARMSVDESGLFSYSKGISSMEYGQDIPKKYADLVGYAFPKKGVKISTNTPGSSVVYNRVVNLNSVSGNLITFEVPYNAESNVLGMSVDMIDVYDPSKVISVNWDIKDNNGVVTYMTVSCNNIKGGGDNDNVAEFGKLRLSYGACNYRSNFQERIYWEGAWEAAGYRPEHSPFHFRFNSKEQQIRADVGYDGNQLDFVVLDMDSVLMMGSNIFEGFTTGEVYLKINFTSLTDSAAIVLTSIAGKDLSADIPEKEPSNLINVSFESPEYAASMPVGTVGVAYPLPTAKETDYVMGNINVGRMIVNERGEKLPITDNTFTPTEAGVYELAFVARDINNYVVVEKYYITVSDSATPISITEVARQSSYRTGVKNQLPLAEVEGGSGNLSVNYVYTINGTEIYPDNKGCYTFNCTGNLHMLVTATDYLGVSEQVEFDYTVEDNPIIVLKKAMPKGLIAGTEFTVPAFEVLTHSNSAITSKQITVNGTAVEDNQKITVPESGNVTIVYAAEVGIGSVTESYVLPVLGKIYLNEDAQNVSSLFMASGNSSVTQEVGGVKFSATSSNNSVTFANPLSAAATEIYLRPVAGSSHEYVEVVLNDAMDETNAVSFRVYNTQVLSEAFRVQDENGIYDFYKYPISASLSETERYHYYYDNARKAIFNINGVKVTDLLYATDGSDFKGFESGVLNVTVKIGGVGGNASFVIRQLGNQQFLQDALRYGDIIAPQLATRGNVSSGSEKVFNNFVIPAAYAVDVLSTEAYLTVTFVAPNGTKLLNNAVCDEEYSFNLEQLGNYKLNFSLADSNGIENLVSYNISSTDTEGPTVTLNGSYAEEYRVGTTVSLLTTSVSDNVSVENEITRMVIVTDPYYVSVKLSEGGSYKFEKSGIYRIRHVAYDRLGNYSFVEQTVLVY